MKVEIRRFNGPRDWPWIKSHIPLLRVEDTCGFVAYDAEEEEPLACVIFDNFTYKTVQAHWIIERPIALRHGLIEVALDFAFTHCNRDRIYGFVAANNKRALRLNARMGFEEVYRIPEGYGPGTDYIVMELLNSFRKFTDPKEGTTWANQAEEDKLPTS